MRCGNGSGSRRKRRRPAAAEATARSSGAPAGEIDPVAFGLVGYRRREALPDLSCRFSTELWTGVLLTLLVVVF